MNNQEFAKLLLCEATELLNESARRKYIDIQKEKYDFLEDKEKTFNDKEDKRLSQYKRAGHEDKFTKKTNPYTDYKIRTAENIYKYGGGIENKTSYTGSNLYNSYFDPDVAKREFNRMINNNSKHGSRLQAKITRRGEEAKKSQNESIAVLLTEAALLLNEFTEIGEIKNPETLAKEKEKKELERRKSISSKLRALELDVASKSNNAANDILKTLTRTGHYGK